jgi:hypothetical protein
MKHVKLFESFSRDHSDVMDQIVTEMGTESVGTIGFTSVDPILLVTIEEKDLRPWEIISTRGNVSEIVNHIRKEFDDILFGETEEEVESSIATLNCYVVDRKSGLKLLGEKIVDIAAKGGLIIDKIYIFLSKTGTHANNDGTMWMFLKENSLLQKKYRGRLTSKKFQFK